LAKYADEKQLVKKAKGGDENAFRILMERYKQKVFSIAYGMVRNPESAMDISQEVFIKVYRYLGGFQGSSSFYTWLYRITVNLSIDYIRKVSKRDMVDYNDSLQRRDPDGFEALVVPTMLDQCPLDSFERKELRQHISKAFEALSEDHRAVLLLREIEGLSYQEIARIQKINKGTVMSRLHHARSNFQNALNRSLNSKAGSLNGPKKSVAVVSDVSKASGV
jgi:RNA polymerase sigma-70 factor (ECF subfamily)